MNSLQQQQSITLQITRKSKRINLTIRPDGAKEQSLYICNELRSMALVEEGVSSHTAIVDEILDRFFKMHKERSGKLGGIIVEAKDVQSTLLALKSGDSHIEESAASFALNHDGSFEKFTSTVSSFEMPAYVYNPVRKVYHRDPTPRSLFSTADAKSRMYQNRANSVSQKVGRSKMFVPEGFNLQAQPDKIVLTSVSSQISSNGRVCVLGMLSEIEEGVWYLEEGTGKVQIDVSNTQVLSGFQCAGTVILAEGVMTDGVFHALTVGQPPSEPRAETLQNFPELEWFGTSHGVADVDRKRVYLENMQESHQDARITVISEIHLDVPETTAKQKALFAGLEPNPPDLLVFMGNFFSTPRSMVYAKERFDTLAVLISQYRQLVAHSMWIFVPGPTDPGVCGMLPLAPLLPSLTGKQKQAIPKVQFQSNPARVLYFGKEFVFFRYDQLQKMRRHAYLHASSDTATTLTSVMCDTVCSQNHQLPMLVEQHGVYWEYDHALALSPLPHHLILADTVEPFDWSVHHNTHVSSPGDFTKEACCMTIYPSQNTIQFNSLDT